MCDHSVSDNVARQVQDLRPVSRATETENPDGKVAVLDWWQAMDPRSTTLHIITFDGRTRFAKLRNPVLVRAGYRLRRLRVRLGDWAGHDPPCV